MDFCQPSSQGSNLGSLDLLQKSLCAPLAPPAHPAELRGRWQVCGGLSSLIQKVNFKMSVLAKHAISKLQLPLLMLDLLLGIKGAMTSIEPMDFDQFAQRA